jgi:hypothetical protein
MAGRVRYSVSSVPVNILLNTWAVWPATVLLAGISVFGWVLAGDGSRELSRRNAPHLTTMTFEARLMKDFNITSGTTNLAMVTRQIESIPTSGHPHSVVSVSVPNYLGGATIAIAVFRIDCSCCSSCRVHI